MIKTTKKDIIWNYIGVIMSLGGNFLILPFMLYYLNGDQLGLWYVFLSIGGFVILFDFGFNPTFARNIAYCWSGGASKLKKNGVTKNLHSEPNILLLKKTIATSKRVYLMISVISLIIIGSIGTWYIFHLSSSINGINHIVAWIIYAFALFINMYYGYFTTFLRGVGAIKQLNVSIVFSRLNQIIVAIILLALGFELLGVAIAYLLYGLLLRLLSKRYFYKHEKIGERLKNNTDEISTVEIISTIKIIWHNAWRDGLVSVSRYLSSQATVLITSVFLTLTETGIYSITLQVVTAIASISGALYTSYQPSLQNAFIRKDIINSKKMMAISMSAYIIMFWIGVAGFAFVGIPLLALIKPDAVFNIPVLLVVSAYIFLLRHHYYYASYISNTNNVPYVKSFVISSILSIIVSLIFISLSDNKIWALILGQMLVQAIYNNWKWPLYVMKSLDSNVFDSFILGTKELLNLIFKRKSYK